MQEVWVVSPDFCLKKKNLQNAHGEAEPFLFAGMRAVIMGGTTPTHPTCEDVSSGVKKIKFLLGPWSSIGSSYWLKTYHFLCNKHQEVSIFNFCKGSMWRVPAPWKKLHIFSTSHQRFFLREAEELEPESGKKKRSTKGRRSCKRKGSLSNQHFSGASS